MKKPILIGLLVSAAIILLMQYQQGDTSSIADATTPAPTEINTSQIKAELINTFHGAYPEEATPTGTVKTFDLVAAESEFRLTHEVNLNTFAYNDQVPGPTLRVMLGETVKVNFKNDLPQPTTIHWHGMRVPNTMDGVPGVTQPPIEPGESFVYEFTPKDPGTYWFHPHVRTSEQMERGLYGVLIVDDPKDVAYHQDAMWVVDDWSIDKQGKLYDQFNTPHDLMHDGRWGNVITTNGKSDEQIIAQPGETIRLRLLNSSNGRVYALDFDNLNAQVIAVDGLPVEKPVNANGFELAPGNRLDVALSLDSAEEGDVFLISDTFTRQSNLLGTIEVMGEPIGNRMQLKAQGKAVNWRAANSLPPDETYRLNAQRGGHMQIEWTIDGAAFPDTETTRLKHGEFNKLRYINESGRLHPMHLHGQFFKVLARNGQPVNEPYFRDTVLVHSKETVDIGLIPFDKGKWAHHCHILEHAEAGMLNIIEVL